MMAKQSMSKNALALPSLSRKLFCRDVTREEAEDLEEVGFGADVVVSWRGAGSVAVESMELVVGAAVLVARTVFETEVWGAA